MTSELILSVGALSLLDTLSPAMLGVTVYLLLTVKERLLSRLLAYLMTVAVFYFTVGAMLMLGVDAIYSSVSGVFQNKAVSWVTAVIGGGLFIGSFYVPAKKTYVERRPKSISLRGMIALGFTTSLIEVATALPYFAAIGLMSSAQLSMMQWIPMLAAYNFIMIVLPLLLYALNLVLGRLMKRALDKLRIRLAKSSSSALSWIMCIAGLILLLNSLDHL